MVFTQGRGFVIDASFGLPIRSLRCRVLVCRAADTASLATRFLFGKLFCVAITFGFGEERCRKNLPLADIDQSLRIMDDSQLTPLTAAELDSLRAEYPALPDSYLQHMASIGWGSLPNGRMLYSGPVHPADIYGDAFDDSQLLLLGDDTCGFCFGFDPAAATSVSYTHLTLPTTPYV